MEEQIQKLLELFEDSFINDNNEIILVPKTNLYFLLCNVKTIEDLYFKVIAWCSRAACKAQPYGTAFRNKKYQTMVRDRINAFLGTDFTQEEWMDIYTLFGNGCRESLCREFIDKNFDFKIVTANL